MYTSMPLSQQVVQLINNFEFYDTWNVVWNYPLLIPHGVGVPPYDLELEQMGLFGEEELIPIPHGEHENETMLRWLRAVYGVKKNE
jgi:hypothetical protein